MYPAELWMLAKGFPPYYGNNNEKYLAQIVRKQYTISLTIYRGRKCTNYSSLQPSAY